MGNGKPRRWGLRMLLRNVEPDDLDLYVRMRCDPAMMADLGGPLPRAGIEAKVARDVRMVTADVEWIKIIVPDATAPTVAAGTVALWSHEDEGERISEVGWMVLPEFQGRGLGKQAVRLLLAAAHADGRWGPVHAFPGVGNGPSNGICRSLGFRLTGTREVTFAGRVLSTNHWVRSPSGP
jgi:RimJ/RimL family protein N-acetyltransferase